MGDSNVFMLLWQATFVVKCVLALLIIMSITSWSLMFQKWFHLSAARAKAEKGLADFQAAKDLREAVQSPCNSSAMERAGLC